MYYLLASLFLTVLSLALLLTAKNRNDELEKQELALKAREQAINSRAATVDNLQYQLDHRARELDARLEDIKTREEQLRKAQLRMAEEDAARSALLSYNIETAYGISLDNRGE